MTEKLETTEISSQYTTIVRSMEEPMINLCSQLRDRFMRGIYGIIIGDDTSGRIPTLAIRGFQKQISEAIGAKALPTVFIQASRKIDPVKVEKQIDERVIKHFSENSGKALLVTDFILHGFTLKRISDIFISRKIDFDVASMSFATGGLAHKTLIGLPLNTEIFIGEEVSWNAPEIYNHPEITGLKRANLKDGTVGIVRSIDKLKPPLKVSLARKDVSALINKLSEATI